MSIRVNLTLSEHFVEDLDYVSKKFYGDVPRASVLRFLARKSIDQLLDDDALSRKVDRLRDVRPDDLFY